MTETKNIKDRFRKKLIRRAVPAVCILFLAGCQNLPFPLNGDLVTNSTSAAASIPQLGGSKNTTAPATTGQFNTTSAAGTTGTLTSPVTITKTTRVIALEKFKAAKAKRTSEKMIHLWSVESKYPLKTGENRAESNYGTDGKVTTAKGSVKENYAGKTNEAAWYLTQDEFNLEKDDAIQRLSKSQVSEQNAYDFDRLVEILLTKYSVTEDTGTYYIKLTTQAELEIKTLMECLGYRKTDQDVYKGSLYLEALLEEATGNLRAVNYVYRNSLDGFTDNGQITFSDWNIPVVIADSEDSTPGTGTTGGEATAPTGTSTSPTSTTTSTTTKPSSTQTGSPGSTTSNP